MDGIAIPRWAAAALAGLCTCVALGCGEDEAGGIGMDAGPDAGGDSGPSNDSGATDSLCTPGMLSASGTIDGAEVEWQSPIKGRSVVNFGSPRRFSIYADEGHLSVKYEVPDSPDVPRELYGSVNVGGETYCIEEATFTTSPRKWDEAEITELAEYIDEETCGASIPANLSVCTDASAP